MIDFLILGNHIKLSIQGSKLSLEDQIGTISESDFLVFVPFTKKRQQTQSISSTADESAMSLKPAELSQASASVWQDIMSDLSSLPDVPQSDTILENLNSSCSSASSFPSHVPPDKKSKVSLDNEDVIKIILSSSIGDTFNQKFGSAMQQLLDSVSCLSDCDSDSCMLARMSGSDAKCACPPWLTRLIKIFTSLNLFYGVIQMKKIRFMNWGYIEDVLKKHAMFGIEEVLMSDLTTLSLLCPKVK